MWEPAIKESSRLISTQNRSELEDACRRSGCGSGASTCFNATLDERGTAFQRDEAVAALADDARIRILDAHAATRGRCNLTLQSDGRHFWAVETRIALDLVSRVVKAHHRLEDKSLLPGAGDSCDVP